MGDYFIGEIRAFSFGFAPNGWAKCNGTVLNVQQNQALYALLGNTYGGSAPTTFALPDLQGRVGISMGAATSGTVYWQGQKAGSETVALTQTQIPPHQHTVAVNTAAGTTGSPVGNYFASAPANHLLYGPVSNATALNPATVGPSAGGQGHDNMQPFLVTNFCISLSGLWPPRG